MPSWLVRLIIQIALTIGQPFIVKYLPFLTDEVKQMIIQAIENIKGAKKEVKEVKRAAVKACHDAACKI